MKTTDHGKVHRVLQREANNVVFFIGLMEDGCLTTWSTAGGLESSRRVLHRAGTHTCWKKRWKRDEEKVVNELSVMGYGEIVA